MNGLQYALTIEELKARARRRVPKMFFDYMESGSWTEQTFRENTSDFARIRLRQRIAVNMENRSLATTMIGQPVALPVALAPTGLTGMQIADGEILAAKAAEAAGVPFTLSTMSIASIEDVAETHVEALLVPALRHARPRVRRAPDRPRQGGEVFSTRPDDGPAGPRPAPQGRAQRPFGAAEVQAEARLAVATRPGWAFAMLGTRRRTFGNIAGHIAGTDDLASVADWTNAQFDPTLSCRTSRG